MAYRPLHPLYFQRGGGVPPSVCPNRVLRVGCPPGSVAGRLQCLLKLGPWRGCLVAHGVPPLVDGGCALIRSESCLSWLSLFSLAEPCEVRVLRGTPAPQGQPGMRPRLTLGPTQGR